MVEGNTVGSPFPEAVVVEFRRVVVELVVAAGTHRDIAVGDLIAGLGGRPHRVLPGGDEDDGLALFAEVGFDLVEGAVEPAVFVGEGVVTVAVGLDVGVELDGAIRLAELEGRLRRCVEPAGHVVDVRHRRRQRDDPGCTEPAES